MVQARFLRAILRSPSTSHLRESIFSASLHMLPHSHFSVPTHCPDSNHLPYDYQHWVPVSCWALVHPASQCGQPGLSFFEIFDSIYKKVIYHKIQNSNSMRHEEKTRYPPTLSPGPTGTSQRPQSWQLPPKTVSACDREPLSSPVSTSTAVSYYVLPRPLLLFLSPGLYWLPHMRPVNW